MQQGMGVLLEDGDRRAVHFERRYDAPVEDVWGALVEPEQLQGWLAEAEFEPRVGGRVVLNFGAGPGERTVGTIRVFDPPRVLEYDWKYEGEPESRVRFELRSEAGGTTLVLHHRLLSTEAAPGYGAGWHAHLDLLGEQLEGQIHSAWPERYETLRPEYDEQAGALTG
jgi:uncharacterized protein YndB with AHSA1/START domain